MAATAADRKTDLTEIPGAKMATNRAILDAAFDPARNKVIFRLTSSEKEPHLYDWPMLPRGCAQVPAAEVIYGLFAADFPLGQKSGLPEYGDMRGTPGHDGKPAQAGALSVNFEQGKQYPWQLRIIHGSGEVLKTGAVKMTQAEKMASIRMGNFGCKGFFQAIIDFSARTEYSR
ncbi:MAG: hypothetical protein M0Z27_01585 [Thermaerobacter sp.]|nr:hypothetical protein [Thermaerobacter sp.]